MHPSPMSSTDIARWAVNEANIEISSNCVYDASKFDMVRLDTCLDGMWGFQDLSMPNIHT